MISHLPRRSSGLRWEGLLRVGAELQNKFVKNNDRSEEKEANNAKAHGAVSWAK